MAAKPARQGGLRIDPAVGEWQKGAALNRATRTGKEKRDAGRVRVRVDVPPAVKRAVEVEAEKLQTGESQVASFLLAWALAELRGGNVGLARLLESCTLLARTLRFEYALEIPPEIEKKLR